MSFDIKPLGRDLLDPAFDLATEVFAAQSTVHRALGIELDAYRAYLRAPFEAMVDEGLSLVATHSSGTVVGCMIATDFHTCLTVKQTPLPFAPLVALTTALCKDYSKIRRSSPGTALLVDMGAVAPEAQAQGIYSALRRAVHSRAITKGYHRVMGELSSAQTQHVVLEKMGHKAVAEIAFDRFEWAGTKPFRNIHDPPKLILSEGML